MKQESDKRIVMMADYLEHSSPEWRDPNQKPQVVSYGEYAAQVFKKTGLNMGGWGLGAIAFLLGLIGLF